ncbi:hypothetical protein QFC21_003948 [Naganishia friedmannii]|uniref:Uncharacterized protein n=1 Tax=Naganishia friedmannii TaxID=89922 RepID=A0ACC2VM04_9TREE|nr:hypothetical protein QFC21_003948 [Naganishia friedmannii]
MAQVVPNATQVIAVTTILASPTAVLPSEATLAAATATSSPIFTSSRWSFTQGFLFGQATFLVLCGLFIKYVVFEDAERSRQRTADRAKKAVLSTTNVPPPSSSELLDKIGYDMASHSSESSDWINVLFAQVLQGYRDDLLGAGGEEGARNQVEAWLNPKGTAMSWLDPITVTSLSLGKSYPLLSNARIRPADGQGGLRAEVDVDYSDSIHLSLATSLVINFPQPRFAILPVALGVELVGFGGTVTMQLQSAPTPSQSLEGRRQVHLSLLPDFHLNLKATSLLGSRAKLQDIPKLEQLVIARLRQAIQDRLVWPRFVGVSLPRLASRGTEPVIETQDTVISNANPVSGMASRLGNQQTQPNQQERSIPAAMADTFQRVSTPSFPGGFTGSQQRMGQDMLPPSAASSAYARPNVPSMNGSHGVSLGPSDTVHQRALGGVAQQRFASGQTGSARPGSSTPVGLAGAQVPFNGPRFASGNAFNQQDTSSLRHRGDLHGGSNQSSTFIPDSAGYAQQQQKRRMGVLNAR